MPRPAAPNVHAPTLRRVPLVGRVADDDDATLGVLVAEEWSAKPTIGSDGRAFSLRGSSRLFLASDDSFTPATVRSWREVSYQKLMLRDRRLSFSVDFSRVGCGCNAAIYLVAMTESASVMESG